MHCVLEAITQGQEIRERQVGDITVHGNRCRSMLAAGLLQIALLAPALAQEAEPGIDDVPELAGLGKRWTAALETLDVPGFAIAVVKDGEVLALDGFGVRNLAGEPATPDTRYYIASSTKPFTAMAVCLLAAQGKLELDASLKNLLPALELPERTCRRASPCATSCVIATA